MRKIAANLIFPVTAEPIKNGYLVIDDSGIIVEVTEPQDNIREIAGLEYYSGILVPGFVLNNTNNTKAIELNILPDTFTPDQKKWARFLYSRGVQAINDKNLLNENAKEINPLNEFMKSDLLFSEQLANLTIKNSQALSKHENLGSFTLDKRPGVLLISGFDFKSFNLKNNSRIKRLI